MRPSDGRLTVSLIAIVLLGLCTGAATVHGQQKRDSLPAPAAWEALEKKDAAKAAAIFREALERSPRNAALHFGAGYAAHMLGRRDAALSALRKAVEIDPEFVSALYLLAQVAYASGDLDLAVRSLEKGVKLRPGDADAARQLEAWRSESNLHRGFAERPGVRFNI